MLALDCGESPLDSNAPVAAVQQPSSRPRSEGDGSCAHGSSRDRAHEVCTSESASGGAESESKPDPHDVSAMSAGDIQPTDACKVSLGYADQHMIGLRDVRMRRIFGHPSLCWPQDSLVALSASVAIDMSVKDSIGRIGTTHKHHTQFL